MNRDFFEGIGTWFWFWGMASMKSGGQAGRVETQARADAAVCGQS